MFRVGQKVVYVNAKGDTRWSDEERPVKGEIYTIARCFLDDEGDAIVHLIEIRRDELSRATWGDDVGYGAFRFRPLIKRKTDISLFTAMLRPSKVTA